MAAESMTERSLPSRNSRHIGRYRWVTRGPPHPRRYTSPRRTPRRLYKGGHMPTPDTTTVVTAIAGLIASFLSGLLGIGGGLVLTPLLLYAPQAVGAGALPVKIVTGLTIVQAISGSVLGSFRHRAYGHVSSRLVWLMGPPSALS